jgi:6-phosphogluconolactonase
MRMKLKKPGQLLLVALGALGVATLLSACNQLTGTLTVDFVFVASARAAGPNSYGEVDVFEVNSESGKMRQIPTSPFPSGGRNPVAEAVSTDHNNLYVVNRDDNTIVQFAIGSDGKVYPQQTVNTPGIFPLAAAVSGSTLYVADTYQPLPSCSPASPCSGSIAAYPILANGNLDTKNVLVNSSIGADYWPLTLPASPADVIAPAAITASGSNLFVAARDTTSGVGYLFGFSTANGTIAPLNNGVPFSAGVQPSAIALDPSGSYVYVTDSTGNNVHAWAVGSGLLTPVSGSPFAAGNSPSGIVIDAAGKFAFVANAQDSNVSAYSIGNGALTRIANFTTDTQPVSIGIDPNLNQYLFTVNFLANTVSGFQVNATNGTLLDSQNSPYASNANPTAVVAVPHGKVTK